MVKDVINSDILLNITDSENKFLIIGGERAGKSSLCNMLFRKYFDMGLTSVKIDGSKIKSHFLGDFKGLISTSFRDQYSQDSLEKFLQLENYKKIILIDDFHKAKLNSKFKALLLGHINSVYPNIIITANDLFPYEELFIEEGQKKNSFECYRQFSIMKFGLLLRSKLIEKWNLQQ